MFPSFIGILDIQSWWEVPSIAYFCSLFRTAFNLLDFDIEELEEALLTDGTEESASSLLTELIVRLLNGCLGNNDISAFNYQMYLRRLFRRKCQETKRSNPFDSDIDFQFLPLRTKVEILYALCDFRLDADDVFDLFKNLEAESLRVEPLGWDDNESAYWYFYGTRLYREDFVKKSKGKSKRKRSKDSKKRAWFYGFLDDDSERVWQVVCFTEEDWTHLTEKFSKATSKVEKELHRSLSQNFLPEIPRLFQEKERLQRKRLLELAPRRTSSRVLQKIKQKEEEDVKQSPHEAKKKERKDNPELARENRARRRNLLRSKSLSSDSSGSSDSEKPEMPQKSIKRSKTQERRPKKSSNSHKGDPVPDIPVKTGRKTNNSLASATGQIVIPDSDEPVSSTRKKLKTSQIFSQTEEDVQTDMYKVLEQLTAHEDAWPFMDPVEEEYAPNYYAVIRRPMDLRKMEERLDNRYYTDFSMFKGDFKLIVNNCRLYNGQDNEYTTMVDNLQAAFDRLTAKYIHRVSSSDEEIAVEYQLPTPSRKHKLKTSESPIRHKRKKSRSHSETGEPKSSTSDAVPPVEEEVKEKSQAEVKKSKESHKSKGKDGKIKKKRKGHHHHHRHGKHSKSHRKDSHKFDRGESSKRHSKRQKHGKNKDKEGKKSKQKKKKNKHHETEDVEVLKRSVSQESLESSYRSRSASPLPSIHTPSPSPTELNPPEPDPDFYKDKYDKIKERRRHAAKDAWDSLFDYKQKSSDKQKQNLNIPEKDKNQKLRETIEKLKAKSEKSPFNSLFTPSQGSTDKDSNTKESSNNDCDDDDQSDSDSVEINKGKSGKRGSKKSTTKNESASEALEQAVKDISKWLDDAPKESVNSSPSDSPTPTISTEEHDGSRLDDESSQGEKTTYSRKDLSRKRPSSREPKSLVKRREIQRTIERLQPGKSKGNLLTNISNKNVVEKPDEATSTGTVNKTREASKVEESCPKLSLGSVLPTVEFTLGKDHNFSDEKNKSTDQEEPLKKTTVLEKDIQKEEPIKKIEEIPKSQPTKKDAEVETDIEAPTKLCQEKATPNLSAWFKAFGAPKSTISITPAVAPKKKVENPDADNKSTAQTANENKITSPKIATKSDSPPDSDTPNPDGGDSPLPNVGATSRPRRTSTGSSVSERSSFSQDLDSPRHQMSHTSPLLRSPASPRTEDFQKITYPIINGTVRAGFYQDTTSIKSSPEKSCSPREGPQSPYSPYSQHVYASNNVTGPSTPGYFADHNKSPLPTYGQNPPPYYDSSKVAGVNKSTPRVNEDYTSLGPDTYPQNTCTVPYSPAQSPYQSQAQVTYSQTQNSPQPMISEPPTPVNTMPSIPDPKATLFPVKKRTYNEPELLLTKKVLEPKEGSIVPPKNDYQKHAQSLNTMSAPSVDDIALALSEKSELAKLREKNNEFAKRDSHIYSSEAVQEAKKGIPADIDKHREENIDMINMGYMNPECDRRNSSEHREEFAHSRDIHKANAHASHHPKVYEVDSMAMNRGTSGSQMQKPISKPNIISNMTPAHSHDRTHMESMNLTHAHQYNPISTGQSISNFSLNDIELANKKLYSCNTASSSAAIDYGNWKMSNQARKQDILPSDYSNAYNVEKNKAEAANTAAALNYNKNMQHQQYANYNIPRSRAPDVQQALSSELKIPNPRLHKGDMNISSSMNDGNLIAKDSKSQKPDKHVTNHPLMSSMSYKTPYTTHSSLPLESLRNLPNIPQMLERYTNDERYLSSFGGNSSALYHDKTFQMAQMFNTSLPSDAHATSTSVSIYSQPPAAMSKDNGIYKASSSVGAPTTQVDTKTKTRRKRTSEAKPISISGSQGYHTSACNNDVLSSVKTSMMPASAFSFGTSSNMALGGGLYGDNTGFSIEDFRNSTANQLMAANYMAAAVAHQQRNNVEANAEKLVKPAHQNSASSSSFPFMGHSQVRGGYPFVGTEPSPPLYQQYLQRHQEELLRQTGAQIMGLYPPTYPAGLAVRQPYDSINRPSWL